LITGGTLIYLELRYGTLTNYEAHIFQKWKSIGFQHVSDTNMRQKYPINILILSKNISSDTSQIHLDASSQLKTQLASC